MTQDTYIPREHMIRVPYDYTGTTLKRVWDEWTYIRNMRRAILHDYYLGKQSIEWQKPDGAHVVVNYSRLIVDTLAEYMVGESPDYQCKDGDTYADAIVQRMKDQNMQDKEVECLRELGKMGVAYEDVYHIADPGDLESSPQDTTEDVKSLFMDPLSTFVAWDYSADPDSVFGCYTWVTVDDAKIETFHMDLYTKTSVQHYIAVNSSSFDSFYEDPKHPEQLHNFGRVPIIEYRTDKYYTSDIDDIVSLQDSYNSIMSDNQDVEDAFASAVLVSKGQAMVDEMDTSMTNDEKYGDAKTTLKNRQMVRLEANGDLSYLVRDTNAGDSKIHLDIIEAHLRAIARVPDFNDANFAGNASGVALKLKLYHLNLKAQARARAYSVGFKRRCKLYAWGMENAVNAKDFTPQANVDDMDINFKMTTINDPLNEAQTAQAIKNTGLVSDKTIRQTFLKVPDEEQEEKRLEVQDAKTLSREKQMYSDEFASASDNAGQTGADVGQTDDMTV